MSYGKMFPVLFQGDRIYIATLKALGCPREVPWSLVAPHEAQAKRNHDQTLQRLAERGGLDPKEMTLLLQDRKLFPEIYNMTAEEAVRFVRDAVAAMPADEWALDFASTMKPEWWAAVTFCASHPDKPEVTLGETTMTPERLQALAKLGLKAKAEQATEPDEI